MQVFLFFALIIAILAIIFAIQNNSPTEVSFFLWQFKGSLALVLLISMAVGALISFLASLPTNIRVRWALRNQRKRLADLEANLGEHKEKLEETQKQLEQAKKPAQAEEKQPEEPKEEPNDGDETPA
jgi:putative membrane protein